MPQVTFTEPKSLGTITIGRYPCRIHIETVMRDAQKNLMLDADGKPVLLRSQAGDEKWDIRALILDGPFAGREIWDNWTFSEKGFGRINTIMVRGGFGKVGETTNLESDDLEGSLWWVTVDRLEDSTKKDKNGTPFKNARVGYAGYEVMSKEETAKYAKMQAAAASGADLDVLDAHENAKEAPPPF